VRVGFSRSVRRPVTVDVLRHAKGRRATGIRRVKRFRDRTRSFTWRARGVGAGYYTVRLRLRLPGGAVDERRAVLQRTPRRFERRPASVRRPDCRGLAAFRLGSPVFGGTTRRALAIAYRLTSAARVRVDLVRRGRIVRRLAAPRTIPGGRTQRLRVRPRGLRRASYAIRLTVRRPGANVRRVALHARGL
jgi:hypothetical protein